MNAVQKRTRWGDRDGRRRDILAAAGKLLAEVGFAKLDMRTLARKAGISAGTLYLYFETKEAIFLTLYAARIDQLRHDAGQISAASKTLEELLHRFADGYLSFYREFGQHLNPWVAMADQDALSALPPEPIAQLKGQVAATFIEVTQRMVELAEAEGLTLIEPAIAVPFVWMTLGGLADGFTGLRASAQPFDWEAMSAFAARTLVRGLTLKDPAVRRRRT